MQGSLAQLRMLQLASASLPVGGYTYSQGLEWAVEAGWVRTVADFVRWQTEQIHDTLVSLDWPVLSRLYAAADLQQPDLGAFTRWGVFLLANRETAELRAEEAQRGAALARLIDGWQMQPDAPWRVALALTQASAMAWLAQHWHMPLQQLLLAHGFAWLEGAVMAGVKLVPFGQQAAQTLLRDLGAVLAAQLPVALQLPDDDIGGGLPIVSIASSCHETQYSRLFRS